MRGVSARATTHRGMGSAPRREVYVGVDRACSVLPGRGSRAEGLGAIEVHGGSRSACAGLCFRWPSPGFLVYV